MKQNQIKNLSISVFTVFVIGYSLILNFSLIGLAGASLAAGAVFLVALVYQKGQGIVEKIDFYILLSVLGILFIHHEQLLSTFTPYHFIDTLDRNPPLQVTALIAGPVLGLIFNSSAKKKEELATKVILKYAGLLLMVLGISIFFWADINLIVLAQQLLVFCVFGLIALCRSNRTKDAKAVGRLSYISFALALLPLLLSVFFPYFSYSPYNASAYLSVTIFPWYSVLGITLLLAAIVGMGIHYGQRIFDEDSIFLIGLVGLTWVLKATVYYHFAFSWIAVCVYVLLFFGFTNRFIKRKKSGQRTSVQSSFNTNEFYWVLIAAAGVVVSVFLIHVGYVYFWLSILIGLLAVLFIPKITSGWVKDAIFWIVLLFSIAGAACTIAIQNGYSEKKILLIAALFVFAGVVMLMLNYKNQIGQNKFKATKIVMTSFFALLVVITAFKGGAQIDTTFENESANVGSLVKEESAFLITATADGKENAIGKLSYVWADSFWHEEADIVDGEIPDLSLEIQNMHLIVWTEDAYGVVTRRDYWFYDTQRNVIFLSDILKQTQRSLPSLN